MTITANLTTKKHCFVYRRQMMYLIYYAETFLRRSLVITHGWTWNKENAEEAFYHAL